MNKILAATFLLLWICLSTANSQIIRVELDWEEGTDNDRQQFYRGFKGAIADPLRPDRPLFQGRVEGLRSDSFQLVVEDARFEPFDWTPSASIGPVPEQLSFSTWVSRTRTGRTGRFEFVPIVSRNGRYERLLSASLRVVPRAEGRSGPSGGRNEPFAGASRLREGQLYKIRVQENGIHRIGAELLEALGIDLSQLDPRQLKLLGRRGGPLPENLDDRAWDDLAEIPVFFPGEEDGRFDAGDAILFYAEGPHRWVLDTASGAFQRITNIYEDYHYYFLQIGAGAGARIAERPSLGNPAQISTAFDDYARLEEDRENLLHLSLVTSGSGREWAGDAFQAARERTYNEAFRFPNAAGGSARLTVRMALKARVRSFFEAEVEGTTYRSNLASAAGDPFNVNTTFANAALLNTTVPLSGESVSLRLLYPNQFGDSQGWLDYIEMQTRRQLRMVGEQLSFRDIELAGLPTAGYRLETSEADLLVWDISDPLRPVRQLFDSGGDAIQFGFQVNGLPEFIAFLPEGNFPQPEAVGAIENQNWHGLQRADALFLFPEAFRQEAERLVAHRRTFSGLEVVAIPVEQVYNEFSGGHKDPTAIRNLAKMMYERDPEFRYLVLFGDGSFDPRDRYGLGGDFIPTYQRNSFQQLFAYPSDDYYALLESGGSGNPFFGDLSIGVGRLPVKSTTEAAQLVDKIIHYETAAPTLGAWRNSATFVADDEDGNLHLRDADEIADLVRRQFEQINVDKIYLDAFPQVSTPGGTRFPAATEALNRNIFQGQMVVTYLGHGGSSGWAQERVLNVSDILSWRNYDQLPLFLTATCSFTGFDDPFEVTAGEEVILSNRGAGIGLMSTVRAVFANSNAALTQRALEVLFQRQDNQYLRLGDVIRIAKNTAVASTQNSRKFALFGDPTMKLSLPEYEVRTTELNGRPIGSAGRDTLRALDQVTIKGGVFTETGQLANSFNGTVNVTVFDKAIPFRTLGQDAGSPVYEYELQKSVLFKGRASVTNGEFSLTFVLPKDINFTFGPGRISYYARQGQTEVDATGAFTDLIIGGTSRSGVQDEEGPLVEVFMNTEDFVFGGITGPDPVLLVKLADDNGINVAGNTIGHDLEGVLNEDSRNTFILNDFYEAALDDYTRGEVRYPLSELESGRYQIRVKAWDVANNSAEGYTEFVVAADGKIALEHVLNYPNPFTDRTCFQFDHNMAGTPIDILVQIYTINGTLVKTLETSLISDGAIRQDNCLEWDGRDDFGDRLARGVYLYRVKVRTAGAGPTTLEGESGFEKLVILK